MNRSLEAGLGESNFVSSGNYTGKAICTCRSGNSSADHARGDILCFNLATSHGSPGGIGYRAVDAVGGLRDEGTGTKERQQEERSSQGKVRHGGSFQKNNSKATLRLAIRRRWKTGTKNRVRVYVWKIQSILTTGGNVSRSSPATFVEDCKEGFHPATDGPDRAVRCPGENVTVPGRVLRR